MIKTKKYIIPAILILILNLSAFSSISAQTKNVVSETTETDIYKNIEFTSQDSILRGRLYLPTDKSEKYPVVVMAHGFTTTINGMTADNYAEKCREAGYALLLYDHRNLGISDGEPRQEINYWVQTRGYIDCIDFAITQPEIDTAKIAVWGCSLSATEAFLAGCIDARVKTIVAQVPGFGKELPTEDANDKIYDYAKKVKQANKGYFTYNHGANSCGYN